MKQTYLQGQFKLHTDSLFEVDDCLQIEDANGWYVHLTSTERLGTWKPNNDYHVLPKDVIERFKTAQ